jgi:hypothetical protein
MEPTPRKSHARELVAAVERLADAAMPGVLARLEPDAGSFERLRARGLDREAEGRLLVRALELSGRLLPVGTSLCRTAWSRFEFVLVGSRERLEQLGRMLLQRLTTDVELRTSHWRLALTEVYTAEPLRTLLCDPGYDLVAAAERTSLAWVRPHEGPDWREPQRYPHVQLLELEGSASAKQDNAPQALQGRLDELRGLLARFCELQGSVSDRNAMAARTERGFALLRDGGRLAQDLVMEALTPGPSAARRGFFREAASSSLFDPFLAARLDAWVAAKQLVQRGQTVDPRIFDREVFPRAVDLALLTRSVELGRTLEPSEAEDVVAQMRLAFGVLGRRPGSMDELVSLSVFRVGGRLVELQRRERNGLARLVVDGEPIPMTLSRTEYSTTNAGSYDRVIEPEHAAAWIDLGPIGRAPLELEVREHTSGVRATQMVGGRLAEIQGTAIHDYASIRIELPKSLERASVALDTHSDTSA